MDLSNLFTVLSDFHPLSDELKQAIEKEIVPLSFPKNHLLLEPPNIAGHVYFLQEGFAMAYSMDDGKKITESFWKPGQIMLAFESFFEQKPSLQYIMLMKRSQAYCLSYRSIQEYLDRYADARHIYLGIMNRHHVNDRKRLREMQRLTTAERLRKLLVAFPNLELNVPQDAIATYLGITAQSLARIKRTEG